MYHKVNFISLTLLSCMFGFSIEKSVLTDHIKPCQYDEATFNVCFKGQMKNIVTLLSDGIPELKVPPLDPMKASDIGINGNGLKLSFADTQVHGVRNCEVLDFNFNFQDDTFKFSFRSNLSLTGKYKVDGKILILPIQGQGDGIVNAINTRVQLKGTLKEDGKSGHLKLTSPTYTYNIERTVFQFKNLFNGNKELSDATHQFANENWREIMDELAPPVVKQLALTYIKALNKFFGSIPIPDIVTDYKKNH